MSDEVRGLDWPGWTEPCSDMHCVLRPKGYGGQGTNGGCRHLRERGPQLTAQIMAMGAEIVAMRARPVIATCSGCVEFDEGENSEAFPPLCAHDGRPGGRVFLPVDAGRNAPSLDCPLRRKGAMP